MQGQSVLGTRGRIKMITEIFKFSSPGGKCEDLYIEEEQEED